MLPGTGSGGRGSVNSCSLQIWAEDVFLGRGEGRGGGLATRYIASLLARVSGNRLSLVGQKVHTHTFDIIEIWNNNLYNICSGARLYDILALKLRLAHFSALLSLADASRRRTGP